jgi:Asp-tRNA(Asn)/Glu-tRNA(Gln) amidotransferase A subunit family amidase
VADGSDFMGSLRNPAGWNHVFGLRPSQGRVPYGPRDELWVSELSTDGPMARSVPAGFDATGRMPMGLQLIGQPQGDAGLLSLAAGNERLIPDLMARCPPL